MTPNIIIAAHSENPPLAKLLPTLKTVGCAPRVVRTVFGEPLPEMDETCGVVVLGAPAGIYQHGELNWLKKEIRWVEQVMAAGKPVFGICLGCQMLAHIHGGEVKKGDKGREFGFTTLHLETAADPLFGAELEGAHVFQAHGDTYSLPKTAQQLASGAVYHQQAAKFAENQYGVQFHPEMTEEVIARWYQSNLDRGREFPPGTPDMAGMLLHARRHLPQVHGWLERLLRDLFTR